FIKNPGYENYSKSAFTISAMLALPPNQKLLSPGKCLIRQNNVLVYNCSTSRGFSGSPIIISDDEPLRFCGVHTHSSDDGNNVGIDSNTEIFKNVYDNIMNSISIW